MTLANEADKIDRFVHEIVHEIADCDELVDYCINVDDEDGRESLRDVVAIIINKWEEYKKIYFKEISDG